MDFPNKGDVINDIAIKINKLFNWLVFYLSS